MLRSIPAAGHPIGVGSVARAWVRSVGSELPAGLLQVYPGALPTNSGTTALWVAMSALQAASPAKKIVLPAYTCPSVAAAAMKAGLVPVLCDMEPGRFVMDKDHLQTLVDEDTLAVVAVHLFGIPEDLESIRARTSGRGVAIIEDATQATANTDPASGRPLGTLGDIGVLSFGRGKPLSVLSGGAVVGAAGGAAGDVRDCWSTLPAASGTVASARYLALLLAYAVLFHPRLFWIPRAMPWFRVGETWFESEFPATRAGAGVIRMLHAVWPGLEVIRKGRERVVQAYRAGLRGCGSIRQPDDAVAGGGLVRYALVFDLPEQRDRALAALEDEGLGCTGMYPAPLHRIPGLQQHFPGDVRCPRAESLAKRILTLPVHDRVRPEDADRIVTLVREACLHG